MKYLSVAATRRVVILTRRKTKRKKTVLWMREQPEIRNYAAEINKSTSTARSFRNSWRAPRPGDHILPAIAVVISSSANCRTFITFRDMPNVDSTRSNIRRVAVAWQASHIADVHKNKRVCSCSHSKSITALRGRFAMIAVWIVFAPDAPGPFAPMKFAGTSSSFLFPVLVRGFLL